MSPFPGRQSSEESSAELRLLSIAQRPTDALDPRGEDMNLFNLKRNTNSPLREVFATSRQNALYEHAILYKAPEAPSLWRSGTGKQHSPPIPSALLVGDDKALLGCEGIFNIEGGCYAKEIISPGQPIFSRRFVLALCLRTLCSMKIA